MAKSKAKSLTTQQYKIFSDLELAADEVKDLADALDDKVVNLVSIIAKVKKSGIRGFAQLLQGLKKADASKVGYLAEEVSETVNDIEDRAMARAQNELVMKRSKRWMQMQNKSSKKSSTKKS